ncbi:SGNH/GDSL hydrolase family protein [Crenothrix sp.]|uniref:SGNH/GDSL hydrolase family protein n=1 Tax=Crenothrix sp. TaxID=3100433 RepID=UPI00374CD72F
MFAPLSLTAAPYAKIVVFGDSLSDMGNLAALPGYEFLNNAPYKHSFTNGITAVGYLAKSLGLPLKSSLHLTGLVRGNNFAVAGAKLSANDLTDLGAQISSFLASQANKARADALYVVFLGGNDIRDMRDKPEAASAAVLKNATLNLQKALTQLIKAGATHFLVVNAPDLGLIPETHARPALIKRASLKSIAFNKALTRVVTETKKTRGVSIVLFDLMTFLNGIVNNGKAYHFNNTQQACYNSTSFKYYAVCNNAKMNSFLFFDEIHPTQRVHERMGRAFFAALPEAN